MTQKFDIPEFTHNFELTNFQSENHPVPQPFTHRSLPGHQVSEGFICGHRRLTDVLDVCYLGGGHDGVRGHFSYLNGIHALYDDNHHQKDLEGESGATVEENAPGPLLIQQQVGLNSIGLSCGAISRGRIYR